MSYHKTAVLLREILTYDLEYGETVYLSLRRRNHYKTSRAEGFP